MADTITVPGATFSNSTDVLVLLPPLKWRDIVVPTRHFRMSLRQDIAEHRYPDQDGAHIEATGRAPFVFTATIPFRNGITAGATEQFSDTLYPQVFRDFITACADRSDGKLSHPEFGDINAKCVNAEVSWIAEGRDGVDVEVTWIESVLDPNQTVNTTAETSPLGALQVSANNLDTTGAQVVAPDQLTINGIVASPAPVLPSEGIPLADAFALFATSLTQNIDNVSLFVGAIARTPGKMIDSATKVITYLDGLKNPKNWPTRQAATQLISSVLALQKSLGVGITKTKTIAFYTVPFEATIGLLAASTQNTVSDIMTLNSSIVRDTVVPAGTVIKYYKVTTTQNGVVV